MGASHGHHGPLEGGAQLCGRLSWTSRTNGRRSPALWAPLMDITDQWKEEPSSVGASHGHHGPMEGGAQLCGRLSWASRTNGRRSPALWAPLMDITDQWTEEPSSVGASHGHHGPMDGGAQLCGRLSWTSRTNGRRSPALWAPLMDITDQWKEEPSSVGASHGHHGPMEGGAQLCGRLSWTSRTNGRRSPALWAPLMDITDQWKEEPSSVGASHGHHGPIEGGAQLSGRLSWTSRTNGRRSPALRAPLMDITDHWKEEPSSVGASHGHHGPMEGGAQLCGRLSWTSRTTGRRSPALWAPLMDITDQWKEEPSSVGASHGHHGPMEGGAQLCGRLSWTSRTNGRRSPALWAPLMDITDQWKEEPSSVGASHGHHGPMEGGAQLCGRLSWTSRTNGRRSPALWAPLMDITDQWKEEPSSVGASHGHHGPMEGGAQLCGRLSWTSRTNGRRSPALWAPLMDITDQLKEEPSSVGASHGHHGPMEGGAQLCGRLSWTSRTNGRRSLALWAPLMDITDQWKEEPSSVGASHGHHGPMEGGAQLCGRLSWTSRTN